MPPSKKITFCTSKKIADDEKRDGKRSYKSQWEHEDWSKGKMRVRSFPSLHFSIIQGKMFPSIPFFKSYKFFSIILILFGSKHNLPSLFLTAYNVEKISHFPSGWLRKNRDTKNEEKQAFCIVCRKPLRAHKTGLERHSETSVHTKNMESIAPEQKKITPLLQVDTKVQEKQINLRMATYIACHSSIQSIDHLCNIINKTYSTSDKGTPTPKLQLHRTKCTCLIKYVIAPNILKDIVDDMGGKSYSLMVDESTDVASFKYMAICVKYFSGKKKKFLVQYLGILNITKADSESLYKALTEYLLSIN